MSDDDLVARAKVALEIYEKVIGGQIAAKEGLDMWPNYDAEKNSLLSMAWHQLYHHFDDQDIYERDIDYKRHATNNLKKIALDISKTFQLPPPIFDAAKINDCG